MKLIFTPQLGPLFVTQFFGASNDNFLKNALLIMVTYQLGKTSAQVGALTNIAAGLFILPFFLFSSFAGLLVDRSDKSIFTQYVKWAEVILMLLAAIGFIFKSVNLLLLTLFLTGTQSAFFSPAKYALLPEQLAPKDLIKGNAWLTGGSYIAIFSGIIGGGLIIELKYGNYICAAVLIVCAIIGLIFSKFIPNTKPKAPNLKVDWNIFAQSWKIIVQGILPQKIVFCCVISGTIFLIAGTIIITQLPLFTRQFLGGNGVICTGLFALFSVGIGIGAFLSTLGAKERHTLSIWNIVAMAVLGLVFVDLALISYFEPEVKDIFGYKELFSRFLTYRAIVDVLVSAIAGGMWGVPVLTLMQKSSRPEILARVIAGYNIINSLAMATACMIAALILKSGFGLEVVFASTGILVFLSTLHSSFWRKK